MDLYFTCIHTSDNISLLAALTDKPEGLVLTSKEKVGLVPKNCLFFITDFKARIRYYVHRSNFVTKNNRFKVLF